MSNADDQVHQIVIVKRKSSSHDDHHGGVWKIAFADFMTAMMAFFLVLWIVNSTSKETQSAIARHFNPIKISDTTPAPRGLKEGSETDFDATLDEKTKESSKNPNLKDGSPLVVKNSSESRGRGADLPGGSSSLGTRVQSESWAADFEGESVHDLEVEFRTSPARALDRLQILVNKRSSEEAAASRGSALRKLGLDQFVDPFVGLAGSMKQNKALQASGGVDLNIVPGDQSLRTSVGRSINEIEMLNSDLKAKMESDPLLRTVRYPVIESSPNATVINIMDSETVSLFAVGSSVPSPRAFALISAIGKVLLTKKSRIILEGHTDGRPFNSDRYNNWNLSTDRAIVAYHILRRIGIADNRIMRIEGYADRNLRIKEDPFSPDNRRIIISLFD